MMLQNCWSCILATLSAAGDEIALAQEEQATALFHAPGLGRHPLWHAEWAQLENPQVIICSVVLFFAGMLCSAGGIGGGGVYVTVLMVAGRLSPRDAVPLSKAVVFSGAIATLVLNLRRSVPAKTLIDYDICRLVVPTALAGTLLGVLLNRTLPDAALLFILTSVLLGMTYMVGTTMWKQYHQDGINPDSAVARDLEVQDERNHQVSRGPAEQHLIVTQHADCRKEVRDVKDSWIGFGVLVIVVACGVLRHHAGECIWELTKEHNATFNVRQACRHPMLSYLVGNRMEDWMASPINAGLVMLGTLAMPLFCCLGVLVHYARMCIQSGSWTCQKVITYQTMGILTGCLAGLVGIGGGLIFSPFFLIMGVDPMTAVATSSTCVIFTSASTTLQYALTDRVILSLTLVYGAVNLLASYAGTAFVHFLQDNFATKKWYITGIVCAGVLVSTILACVKLERAIHL